MSKAYINYEDVVFKVNDDEPAGSGRATAVKKADVTDCYVHIDRAQSLGSLRGSQGSATANSVDQRQPCRSRLPRWHAQSAA